MSEKGGLAETLLATMRRRDASNKQELAKKAAQHGVHLTEVPCAICGGSGHFLRPDPLDLRLLREGHAVSKPQFAKYADVSVSFVHKVEEPDPEKGAPCSAKLLAKYLGIPDHKWGPKRDSAFYERLATMPLAERQEYMHRALARKRELAERRAANPGVEEGQIWERVDSRRKVRPAVRILHVEDGSALVKPYRDEKAKPLAISLKTLKKSYVCVSENLEGAA